MRGGLRAKVATERKILTRRSGHTSRLSCAKTRLLGFGEGEKQTLQPKRRGYNGTMRVALHTPFVVQKHTGIARHLWGLLRGLAQTDLKTEYLCFLPPTVARPDWFPDNFTIVPYTIAANNPVVRVLREQQWIAEVHHQHGFDVLHSPFGYLPPRLPCPAVVTVHDCRWLRYPKTFTFLRGTFLRWAIPRSIRNARITATSSEATRQEVLQLFPDVSPERVRTVHLGLDEEWFTAPSEAAIATVREQTKEKPFFLAVGTQEPHKNLPRLLEAFALLQSNRLAEGDVLLYLVGVKSFATGKHDNLARVLNNLSVRSCVVLPGAISDDELRAAYRGAVALCFPSYYEGFGYPPLEAMAAGTPVLASNASCIPEIVGDAAEFVDPFSTDSMAAGMARLLTDEGHCQELIEKGIEQVRSYTWERHAQQMRRLYQEATLL